MKSPTNVPASVRQRLLNRARSDKRPFSELLQYYAMERFLYRLSRSPHANRFILKGALLLKTWSSAESRPTMDIDMLGQTSNDEADIVAQIRDILAVDVEEKWRLSMNYSISYKNYQEHHDSCYGTGDLFLKPMKRKKKDVFIDNIVRLLGENPSGWPR